MRWLRTTKEKTMFYNAYASTYEKEIKSLNTLVAGSQEEVASRINSKIMTAGFIQSLAAFEEVELLVIGRMLNHHLLTHQEEAPNTLPLTISRAHAIIIKNKYDKREMFIIDISGSILGITLKSIDGESIIIKSTLESGLVFYPLSNIQQIEIVNRPILPSTLQLFKTQQRLALLRESLFNLTAGKKTKYYLPGTHSTHITRLIQELEVDLKPPKDLPGKPSFSVKRNIMRAIRDAAQFAFTSLNDAAKRGFTVNAATNRLLRDRIASTTSSAMNSLATHCSMSSEAQRILTYEYDFAKESKNTTVRYKVPNKEAILLDHTVGHTIYKKLQDDFLSQINLHDSPLDISSLLLKFTLFIFQQFANTPRSLPELTQKDSVHFLHEFCEAGTGVGRHMSFLAAHVLGNIVIDHRDIFSDSCSVRVYRSITNKLTQHSMVVVNNHGDVYIIDPALQVLHKIRADERQKDLNECCHFYDKIGMSWVLHNLALSLQLSIPQACRDKPIEEEALDKLDEILTQSDNLAEEFQDFMCPISRCIMKDPVYVYSGGGPALCFEQRDPKHPNGFERHVFDRASIEAWQNSGRSHATLNPINRLPIFLIKPAYPVKINLIRAIVGMTALLLPEETVATSPNKQRQITQLSIAVNTLSRLLETQPNDPEASPSPRR